MLETFLVDEESNGQRLDVFLANNVANLSRSALVKYIEKGDVCINGVPTTSKREVVKLGDKVRTAIVEEKTARNLAQDIPLDIRYEDKWLGVLSKQAGLLSHPSPQHKDGTLTNALVARYGVDGLGTLQGDDRLGLVHRLDAETSGLMLFAKDDKTQQALQDQIRMRDLDRRYIALVHGNIGQDSGLIDTGIAHSRNPKFAMAVTSNPEARQAITTFEVLERFEAFENNDGFTLVECHLYTGRTHQIRVHMNFIKHPVVGDPMHGAGDSKKNMRLSRQFLHSYLLSFEHSKTGEMLHVRDGLPQDLLDTYNKMKPYTRGRTEAGDRVFSQLKPSIRHEPRKGEDQNGI